MDRTETYLTFKNYGVAYAHLTLPVGVYEREVGALMAAIQAVSPAPLSSQISFLTGQSDVMLELQVRDFRSAVHLQYPSDAMGANWLFLVPYCDDGAPPAAGFRLNYVIHLRFLREAYRGNGVSFERRVVLDLQQLAASHGLSCEVMAGFGWSDLAIRGTFARVEHLRRFIAAIEDYDGGRAVHRSLTLVGYDRGLESDDTDESVTPILFVRALPTHIDHAASALRDKLPFPEKWTAYVIDGKWDLVYSALEPIPLRDYLKMHREQVVRGTFLQDAGIERFESHLVAKRVDRGQSGNRSITRCGCRKAFDQQLPHIIDPRDDAAGLLPRALRRAILNVTDLFRAASRDNTNCCDVVPTLLRCAAAGRRLVQKYRRLTDKIERAQVSRAADEELTAWLAVLARAREDIEDWCTYSERSVSQRTVGRFEEFLAQNERVVSYRGGIQKMLYIADVLTDAYAKQILSNPADRTFVTLYDPVDTVVNMRSAGFIRVPVRFLFFLPIAVTHLWHEVGVHAFFCNYSIPFDKRAMLRASDFADLSPAQTAQGRMREAGKLLVEVAEMYGDLVTFHYGFRENVESFVLALGSATLEQVGFHSATSAGKERYFVYLLTRLYLVVEFKSRRDLIAAAIAQSPGTCKRDEIDAWRPATKYVRETIRLLGELLNRELLSHARYFGEPAASIELRQQTEEAFERIAAKTISAIDDFDVAHRKFMTDLAWNLPPVAEESSESLEAFEGIQRGEVVTMGTNVDPNAVYQRLQRSMIEKIRDVPHNSPLEETFLRSIATLMRSVLLSFYARERETPAAARESMTGLMSDSGALQKTLPDLDLTPGNLPFLQERAAR